MMNRRLRALEPTNAYVMHAGHNASVNYSYYLSLIVPRGRRRLLVMELLNDRVMRLYSSYALPVA